MFEGFADISFVYNNLQVAPQINPTQLQSNEGFSQNCFFIWESDPEAL
jgi:hypothetical protein